MNNQTQVEEKMIALKAGAACIISSASPFASSPKTSMRTTSSILSLSMLKADALPTFPAPIIVIILTT